MSYNKINPDQQAQNLISSYCKIGLSHGGAKEAASLHVNNMLNTLKKHDPSNADGISFWNEVLSLIKYY